MTNENTHNQSPVQIFRDRAISVSVWENHHTNPETGETKIYHSLDLQRGYKKGDEWKHTSSINGDDALRVSNLYQEAYRWISTQKYSLQAEQAKTAGMQQSTA